MLNFLFILLISHLTAQQIPETPISPDIELIPLHHDDQGFAPLKVPEEIYHHYWNNIPSFIDRLKQAFIMETHNKQNLRGIQMPNWIIWRSPSIVRRHDSLTLYLSDQSLTTPIEIGTLNLKKSNLPMIEGVKKIRKFLDKYVTYDSLQYTAHQKSVKKTVFDHYWTEIDDLIMQMLLRNTQYQASKTDKEETFRLIGEFFRWRQIIKDFCIAQYMYVNELTLPATFKDFLIKKHNLPEEQAEFYKNLLDIRRLHLGIILIDPSKSEAVLDTIFQNFTYYSLTSSDEQANRYREEMFPT